MGLSFLVPAFLAGLLAIGVPIWVHLRNRTKTETIEFPSLMFLERIPYRSVQKQTLRHRALFAMRVLVLGLLALAFARPFFGDTPAGISGPAGTREVVVMLDRSWSMGYGDHWDQAVALASGVASEAGPGDRVSLVLFDQEATVAVQSSPDVAALQAALGAAAPGYSATSYAAGFRAAQRILAESSMPRREAVIVSDFQRNGWDPDIDIELPQGTVVRPLAVGESGENVSVVDVTLRRLAGAAADDPEQVAVVARITRQGGEGELPVPVRLELDGIAVQERGASLPASGAARVEFDPVPVGELALNGTVSVGDDDLPGDNDFFFIVAPGQAVPVLILENPVASGSDSLFIERALRIGSDPTFRVERALLSDLGPSDLEGRSLVILNDVGAIDQATAASLGDFLRAGGGVLLGFAELSPDRGADDLLPFAVGPPSDRSAELGASLAYLDTGHPALELFGDSDGGDFATARFYRYRSLLPAPERGVLARFDDGAPALVELTVGAGRLLVWTSSLDNFWSDFTLQPVFLPFVHQVAKHAANYREPPAWLASGPSAGARQLVAAASGGVVADATGVAVDGARIDQQLGQLAPGFHRVDWQDGSGASDGGSVAMNLERTESDLTRTDPEEIAAAAVWRAGGAVETGAEVSATPEEIEGGQSGWWYLLILAFLLLIAETALSNRLSPRAS